MRSKKSKIALFTNEQFKKASRIERMHMHLLDPDRFYLPDEDFHYLEKLKLAFAVISNTLSRTEALKKIEAVLNIDIRKQDAYKYYNDSRELFGNIIKSNKDFDRLVLREKLVILANTAEAMMNIEEARKCYEAIMKLDALDKHGESDFNPEDFQFPTIIFSDDPSLLEDAEIDE